LLTALNRYPPLTLFEHYDHGKDADPTFPDLLPKDTAETDDITPFIGTEVKGVQLSKLSQAGKDQLARFVAQRRVVGKSLDIQTAIACFLRELNIRR
jgi:sulfonate dioxygenase